MNDSDKKDFAVAMYAAAEMYDRKVSKDLLLMYFTVLNEFSVEDIKAGLNAHVLDPKHGTFFPKPADIVRHLQTGNLSPEEKAELAWAQLQLRIRHTGSYGSLKLDDKQALAAVKAFTTWKELCKMDVDKMTWAKKEFMSTYSTYDKTPVEMLPSSLPGRIALVEHKQNDTKSLTTILDKLKDMNNER